MKNIFSDIIEKLSILENNIDKIEELCIIENIFKNEIERGKGGSDEK